MKSRAKRGKLAVAGTIAAASAIALAPDERAWAQPPRCEAWDIEYALAANLRLADTPMGQGDGVHTIGPGKVVLRFDDRGQPGGNVKMLSFDLREGFTVKARTLVWTTTVATDAVARATPDRCGVAADGTLDGTALRWSGPVRGCRTDGSLTCDGSLCGTFGAPPSGQSAFHIGPEPVTFGSFQFSHDAKTFTMASTFISKTDAPKQTAYLALSGRETKRSCVPAKAGLCSGS